MKLSNRSKGAVLISALLVGLVSLSGSALADPARLVSAPTGTQQNGWYTQHPTAQVQAVCNGTPTGNVFSVDVAGWSWSGGGTPEQSLPGKHTVELLSNDIGNIYINNDGTLSPYLAGGCSNPDGSSPTTVLWQGTIQWDGTSPTISITSPSNNSNAASTEDSITVSGAVNDTGSGIQSVTVNGVKATVNGSTFSANVSLSYGLNTISAIATSNSEATTTSQSISVNRYENPSSGSGNINPTTTSASKPSTTPTSTKNSSGQTNNTGTQNSAATQPTKPQETVSTPTKVAGGVAATGAAGLATASYLGYIPYKKIGLLITKIVTK